MIHPPLVACSCSSGEGVLWKIPHAWWHATLSSYNSDLIQVITSLRFHRCSIPDMSIRYDFTVSCSSDSYHRSILCYTWYLNLKCSHCSLDPALGTWSHAVSFSLHFEQLWFCCCLHSLQKKASTYRWRYNYIENYRKFSYRVHDLPALYHWLDF